MTENQELSNSNVIPLSPPLKKIDLHNLTAIRREMNSVYRDARNGTIEDSQGTKFIYMLTAISKVYETGVLEHDVRQIQTTLNIRANEKKDKK